MLIYTIFLKKCRILVVLGWLVPLSALAQTPTAERPPFQATFFADLLRDLPASGNVFAILEATQQQISSDRFYTGGLSTGEPARLGAQLASPAQNIFRIGDINITDPDGSGAPMLFPELQYWQRLAIFTGHMPPDRGAPGLAVSLDPRQPTDRWTGELEGSGSPGWVAGVPAGPPAIARLNRWGRASAVVSGRPADRLGVTFGAGWTRGSQFLRSQTVAVDGSVGSGFGQVVFTPNERDEIRTLGWVQRAVYPFNELQSTRASHDTGVHAQSTWERRVMDSYSWRLFGGFTRRARAVDQAFSPLIVERLVDGPVADHAPATDTTANRLSFGTHISPAVRTFGSRVHATHVGAEFERTDGRYASPFTGWIGERMDGLPARAWLFSAPAAESRRSTTFLSVRAGDEIELSPRVTAAAGLRFEMVTGDADGAATNVSWMSVLPHARFKWHVSDKADVSIFSGYARTGDRLLFSALAVGDPAAPVANVYRWDIAASPFGPPTVLPGPLVARVGPGTGGDPAFSRIDPDLARPITDEWTIGIDSKLVSVLRWQLAGFARWEHDDLVLRNAGVGTSDYSLTTVPNPGGAVTGPSHSATEPIPVFNRLPSSFGRDRYELVNSPLKTPRVLGVDLTFYAQTSRLFLTIAGTAQLGNVNAGYRGFRANENDQGGLGDVLSDPNSTTFAYGRPFLDRGFTGKLTLVYQLPMDIRLGTVARYQDGQAFSGLILVPTLAQGADVVRPYENGGTRFTYVGTLDVRLQKGFLLGGRRLELLLDGYNLSHLQNEVEERAVIGPGFRDVTSIQPPLAIHLGARVIF